MGYNLYVTRKDEWFDEHGEEIELEEWTAAVASDPGLEMRAEAFVDVGDGKQLIASDPTMAVWLDEAGNPQMWFHMFEGNIIGKNPRPPVIAKMHDLSVTLQARLMGEEGEVYDAEGNVSYPDFPEPQTQKAGHDVRPWWKFW
ncbi:MAG: hypothetical protein ACSHWY_06135 [Octadecabacter sp.]